VTDDARKVSGRTGTLGGSTRNDAAPTVDVMSTNRPSVDEVRATTAETARSMAPQRVPVNAYEAPGAFVIVAPVPAVTDRDVTVELTRGTVRICAELRSAGPREYAIHEWEYGGYERQVDVPEGYGSGLEAALANGQLVVRVLSGAFERDLQIHPTAN
jgi:HSP20 family molecular chaperone IbpA